MCIFGGPGPQETPKFEPLQTYQPAETRQQITANPLKKGKDVDEVGEPKEVAYGGEQTKSTPAAGKKKGASQLKIALNTANGASTGGFNV